MSVKEQTPEQVTVRSAWTRRNATGGNDRERSRLVAQRGYTKRSDVHSDCALPQKAPKTKHPAAASRCQQDNTLREPKRLRRRVRLLKRAGLLGHTAKWASITRAISCEDLHQAYQLVHDVFVEKGYIEPQSGALRVRSYEASAEMATFVAKTEGRVVAVLSIVPDSDDLGLPSDRAFQEELDELRLEGRKIAEITNNAVAPEYRKTPLFMELIRACMAHALSMGIDNVFVSSNPGHAGLFRGILQAEPWGRRRKYSQKDGDLVEGTCWDLSGLEERFKAADSILGSLAFLHRSFYSENPYRRYVRPWTSMARRSFVDSQLLRLLFVERTGLLDRLSDEERSVIRRRWGPEIFDAVVRGVPTAAFA